MPEMRVGSHWEHVTITKEAGDVMANIILPAASSTMTTLAVGQRLYGQAYPWKVTETCTSCWVSGWNLTVIHYAGALISEFLLVQASSQSHMARVCCLFLDDKGKDGCNFPWCSLDLNLVENLWEIMDWCLNADKKHHRLHSNSLMPWSKSGGRSSRTPSTVSSEWGHKHYWATLWLRLDRPVISGFNFAIWCNLQGWLSLWVLLTVVMSFCSQWIHTFQ